MYPVNHQGNNYLLRLMNNETISTDPSSADSSLMYPPDFPKITFSLESIPEEGYYFLSLNQLVSHYLTILDNSGNLIFYQRETKPTYDFKIQPSGILTYFSDERKKFLGLDSLYSIVDSFYTGNGLSTNFHDLQVMADGNAFLIGDDQEPVDMDTVITPGLGYENACVQGCVIQEIDKQKRVIWQWRSWDHYNITDADSTIVDLTQHTIYYCHLNSIDVVNDTMLIISTRHFDEVTAINRETGNIIWRFGGKRNQFLIDGKQPDFRYQHDARYLGNNRLSLYDNGYPKERPYSKGIIFQLDQSNHTGKTIKELRHNPDVLGYNMGNLQVTRNDD